MVDSLDILSKDLTLFIDLDETKDWVEILVSFLNRVAELGHVERFDFSADWDSGHAKKL